MGRASNLLVCELTSVAVRVSIGGFSPASPYAWPGPSSVTGTVLRQTYGLWINPALLSFGSFSSTAGLCSYQ